MMERKTQTVAGHDVFVYPQLTSTMDEAWHLAESGIKAGVVVCAYRQERGRGRQLKEWVSPEGGLYFSVIFDVLKPGAQSSLITLTASVALCKALNRSFNLKAQIKWPNDIMLNDKKLAGILTEVRTQGDSSKAGVLGIGLNIKRFEGALETAAFVEDEGVQAGRMDVLEKFLEEFDCLLASEGNHILNQWREHSDMLGKHVIMKEGKESIEGVAQDIDEDGGLLLRISDGNIVKKVSGEVFCVRQIETE